MERRWSVSKEGLANEIHAQDSHSSLFANECERFGMTWGCRPDCPVFERGECKIQEENQDFFDKEEVKP